MPLLNILWPAKTKGLLFLFTSLACVIVLVWPLIKPPTNPFYTIDPDVPYVANALLFSSQGLVHFTNHPGIPLTLSLAMSFWPLRIWAKLVQHVGFVDWSLENITFLMWYSRILMVSLFFTSVYFLLAVWFNLTKSIISAILGLALLFGLNIIASLPSIIWAESYLFFITSSWLLVFVLWVRSQKTYLLYIMAIVSGVAIATKFTAFPILLATIVCVLFLYIRGGFKQKYLKILLLTVPLSLFTFFLITKLVHFNYLHFFGWISSLVSHSGVYGTGSKQIVDFSLFGQAVYSFIGENKVLLGIAIMGFCHLFLRGENALRRWMLFMALVLSICILITAKFIHTYYHVVNLIFLITFCVWSISHFNRKFRLLLIIVLSTIGIPRALVNLDQLRIEKERAVVLEAHVNSNTDSPVLWEWAKSKDFALLWGRDWSGGFYNQQLSRVLPRSFSLMNFKSISGNDGRHYPIAKSCWEGIYIQEVSLNQFLESNQEIKFGYPYKIPATQIVYLKNPLANCPN